MLFGVFPLCLTSKLSILAAFKHLPVFEPKSRNMTPLKRHFLQTFLNEFFLNVDGRRQIDAGEVLRRCLPPFLSYREKPAGGRIRPSPAGRVLRQNCQYIIHHYLEDFHANLRQFSSLFRNDNLVTSCMVILSGIRQILEGLYNVQFWLTHHCGWKGDV